VYRAVYTNFDKMTYSLGSTIKWNTFSVCSTEYSCVTDLIEGTKGIIFLIQSKNGRLINKYSKTPEDNDVIFLPESTFRITAHYVASIICLGQKNIRKTAYVPKDIQYDKMEKGELSVVVELEEI
jgi:hypothetical protein